MAGFEPQMSGLESDHSTNWATTTANNTFKLCKIRLENKVVPKTYYPRDI